MNARLSIAIFAICFGCSVDESSKRSVVGAEPSAPETEEAQNQDGVDANAALTNVDAASDGPTFAGEGDENTQIAFKTIADHVLQSLNEASSLDATADVAGIHHLDARAAVSPSAIPYTACRADGPTAVAYFNWGRMLTFRSVWHPLYKSIKSITVRSGRMPNGKIIGSRMCLVTNVPNHKTIQFGQTFYQAYTSRTSTYFHRKLVDLTDPKLKSIWKNVVGLVCLPAVEDSCNPVPGTSAKITSKLDADQSAEPIQQFNISTLHYRNQ